MAMLTKRQQAEQLVASLKAERASFEPHWKAIGEVILPRRPQWVVTDINKGQRVNQKVIDETGALAARTLAAGMMAGMTSPAREWKRLTTHDPGLAEFGPVKQWLHLVDTRMSAVFARSNLYKSFPSLYGDLGGFGTSAMLVEEDFDNTLRTFVFPLGSYYLGLNDRLQVVVFAREYRLSVRQVVMQFGRATSSGAPDWSVFSPQVKAAWDRSEYEQWVNCTHVIQPHVEHTPQRLSSKPFESLSWETGNQGPQENRFLRQRGYDRFPVLVGRWDVTGEDIYGTNCPGMTALGSIKQLQLGEKRIMQAVEKKINPPLIGPSALRNQRVTLLPGDVNYVDEREGMKGLRPVHEVEFSIAEMEEKQRQKREIINECFFKNLFLMFATLDRREITATEIQAREQEKLILGPVLEQLNQDVYDPLVDHAFDLMWRQGMIPPPPPELQGQPLKIEYISIMHQVMKIAGLSAIDRLVTFMGQVAGVAPETVDKMDFDQAIDEYAEILGTPPRIVRPDADVAALRRQRAQEQQKQEQLAALQAGAKTAKDLAGAGMESDSLLTRMTDQNRTGQLVEQQG